MKKVGVWLKWIVILALGVLVALMDVPSGSESSVAYDNNMKTNEYSTNISVGNDGSYTVTEKISVKFLSARHGIYRYIPYKGSQTFWDKSGKENQVLYYGNLKIMDSNEVYEKSTKDGSVLLRFGDEDTYVNQGNYQFTYQLIPKFQDTSYDKIYYNIFPNQWGNKIPAGSTFKIKLPKKTDLSKIAFYYGKYGERKDASSILNLKKDDVTGTITGTLKEALAFENGLTCYGQMNPGYFSSIHKLKFPMVILAFSLIVILIIAALYFFFGKDEKIISSIQYQPPEGLDSAAVGYIVDGSIENEDITSLILYWADKGYLRIEEKEKGKVVLYKLKEIAQEVPSYQKYMFQQLFSSGDCVKVADLKYKFAEVLQVVRDRIKLYFHQENGGLFTKSSKIARVVSSLMTPIPMGFFILMFTIVHRLSVLEMIFESFLWICLVVGCVLSSYTVDKWYAMSESKQKKMIAGSTTLNGICLAGYSGFYLMKVVRNEMFQYIWLLTVVVAVTIAALWMTAFMKKRTSQCVEWMGRLAGLKDFIETAELDRMKVLAQDHPNMFYHILPYAAVFGLFDVFSKKLDALEVPAPDWYVSYVDYPYFNYFMLVHCMENTVSKTLTIPEPQETDSNSGGFGGGSFGGGGFSGGGFGGGGGGSW